MKTCPKCGAENRITAPECRLCATRLESSEDLLVARAETGFESEIPATVLVSGAEAGHFGNDATASSSLICPNCHGANEADWLFCQQCGAKLSKPEPAPAPPAPAPPAIQPGNQIVAPPPDEIIAAPPIQPDQPDQSDQGQSRPSKVSAMLPQAPLTRPERPGIDDQLFQQADLPPGPAPDQATVIGVTDPLRGSQSASGEALPKETGDVSGGRPRAGSEPLDFKSPHVCCVNCGEQLPSGAVYCASCGVKISGPNTGSRPRSPGLAVIQMITEGGQIGDTYSVPSSGVHIGRVEGEVTFPHDGYMSGRHAQIIERDGEYFLVDQNSRNGTFIRIRGETELKPGDTFLVGKQVFRFSRK